METIKNKLLGILLLFLISFPVIAQNKVYIESFTHDPMDQAAKVYGKYDSSGNMYAIVKVRPTGKDFKFSFGYMASSVQGEHDNETWLYVQKNARKVTIKRDGFTTINNEDLGMTLEAGQTYILNLSYVEPSVISRTQWLKFSVSPSDANAIIRVKREGANNYEIWGQTNVGNNGSIAKQLSCGRYQYQIVADNYSTSEGVVILNKPDETHNESVNLNPNYGYLQIDNTDNYDGAQVIVDNKVIGTLPYSLSTKWPIGNYEFSIISSDELFKPYSGSFSIKQGEKTVLKPKLESNAAKVTLRLDVPAEIYIDGVFKANDKWSGMLKSGRHEVECRQGNHRPTKKIITIEAGQTQNVVLESPSPITGSLSVNSNPLDAEIIIDGVKKGRTPSIVKNILVGNHSLIVRHEGYYDETRNITIEETRAREVSATLKRKPKGPFDDMSYYIQPMYQAVGLTSIGAAVGLYISKVNIEASYLMGMGEEKLYWSHQESGANSAPIEESFSANYYGGRIGYGFDASKILRITPQIGMGVASLSGSEKSNGYAMNASVGSRIDILFSRYVGLNVTPEYSFAISQSDMFSAASAASNTVKSWGEGFNAKVGLLIYF